MAPRDGEECGQCLVLAEICRDPRDRDEPRPREINRDCDAPRSESEARAVCERIEGRLHRIAIVQRLALSHEHDVADGRQPLRPCQRVALKDLSQKVNEVRR